MAEVVGIITSVAATIQQSIELFQAIRSAINSRKNLYEFINQHCLEARRTSQLIKAVRKEASLQTPSIICALQDVDEAGKRLNSRLKVARESLKKSNIRLIGNALFPNPDEDKKLQIELKELELSKNNLNSCILLYNVSLSRNISDNIRIQTISMSKLNRMVKALGRKAHPHEKMAVKSENMVRSDLAVDELSGDSMDVDIDDPADGSPHRHLSPTIEDAADADISTKTIKGDAYTIPTTVSPSDSDYTTRQGRRTDHTAGSAPSTPSTPSFSRHSERNHSSTTSSTATPRVYDSTPTRNIKGNDTTSRGMMFNGTVPMSSHRSSNVDIIENKASHDATMFNGDLPAEVLLKLAHLRTQRFPNPQ
ncbi:uncharacterized protein F4822DRAFT_190275 [Hypoxylon trugodes]|uniref:uncharacterized protein n=1 Tax=Hypoxylon trugodes TaxID=326681 RepID=UPI002194521D|nr:uncharacterized protein F4822DRAFT_190275 [Hypoxylon trugodes]KAI1391581.1 hypothetical protein F4822DRAFT_190275 [Hypoxylon trugodes]